MFSITDLVNTAYRFTKNHISLWFFGFFLTSWGGLSFIRRVDLNEQKLIANFSNAKDYVVADPGRSLLIVLVALFGTILMFCAGAIARSVIIQATLKKREENYFTLKSVLKDVRHKLPRVFFLGVIANLIMFATFVLLIAPLYISFSKGMFNTTVILGISAAAIYLPVVVTISLVNIFAASFVIIYDMTVKKALAAAFDLISGALDKIVSLFALLLVLYAVSFLISFLLFSTVSGLIYFLGFNLKTLAISSFFVIIVAALVLLALVMLLVNAILNVFTNICWTLFFLEVVKDGKGSEHKRMLAQDTGG